MTTQRSTRMGRRSILVAVLALAAIVGWWVGAMAGQVSRPAPSSSGPSVVPSVAPTPASTPSPSPTATISVSAGPEVSGAPVLELSGTGDKTSADFTVRVGWQIQWQTDADHLTISIDGSQHLGKVVDLPGPASGVTSPPVSGTFHLTVTAQGSWSLKVIQGTG